jgi:hypothetical protein
MQNANWKMQKLKPTGDYIDLTDILHFSFSILHYPPWGCNRPPAAASMAGH